MMKTIRTLLSILTIAISLPLIAAGGNRPVPVDSMTQNRIAQWMHGNGGLSFLENKGQMADMQGKPVKDLLFRVSGQGADMYVTTTGLSYIFTHKVIFKTGKPGEPGKAGDSITGEYCRADMQLVGADIRKENIVKEYESFDYSNYYLGNCPDGILFVHSYQKITVKNIYPGIDWVLYTSALANNSVSQIAGLQYDFIVHPGADPSLIKLKYKWADKPEMKVDGSLKINLPLGEILEGTPVSHTIASLNILDKQMAEVITGYTIHDNEVCFTLGNYNKNETLVIDPSVGWTLHWSTYYGGSTMDEDESIMSDGSHVWVSGNSQSNNFPTVNPGGATYYQGTLTTATQNAVILCFTPAGAAVWATYYGGTNNNESDDGMSISSDGTNVWVAVEVKKGGGTFPTANPNNYTWYQTYNTVTNTTGLLGTAPASGNNVPTTCPAVLEFNTAGVREYATFLSGTTGGKDYPASIWDDGTNVWFVGYSTTNNFPVLYSAGYYNSSSWGGSPMIAEFSAASGNLLWCTLWGTMNGTSGQATSVCSDGTNVWLTGKDLGGLPAINPGGGAYYAATDPSTTNQDVFIGKINIATHNNVWATYFAGTPVNNDAAGQGIYSNGTNVWVVGYTDAAAATFPTVTPAGAYAQAANGGGPEDAFVSEFDINGVQIWASLYGGTREDEATSISVDPNSDVWVAGYTKSSNFPLQNLGCSYNQSSLAGNQNAFLLEFNGTGASLWATYFGGGGKDEAFSIFSTGSDVWLSGESSSANFPTVNFAGAYNQAANAGNINGFISNFEPSLPLTATMGIPTDELCNGDNEGSATVTVTGATAPLTYSWSASGGTNAMGTGLSAGTFTVYITDANGCKDSSMVTITQPPAMVAAFGRTTNVSCAGDQDGKATVASVLGGTSPFTYIWSPSGGTNATGTGFSAGTYTVTVTDNNGCTSTSSVTITQPLPLSVTAASSGAKCFGYTNAIGTATPSGGTPPFNYVWDPGGIRGNPGRGLSAGNYTVTVIDSNGCTASATVVVTQPEQTVVGFTTSVTGGCSPLCIQFSNATLGNTAGISSFLWTFGDKDTSHAENPVYCYVKGGVYSVGLTVISDTGCSASLQIANLISVYTSPVAAFAISPQPTTILSPTIQFTDQSQDTNKIAVWAWTFGDANDSINQQQNPVHTYGDTGRYCVQLAVTNEIGCSDTITNCLVIDPLFTLYIPDAFSPDGDGLNDVFMVKGKYVKGFEMDIFNRWGVDIFHSDDINEGWNGVAKGGSAISQADTYVYKILVTDDQNKQHSYVGTIVLVK